MAFDENGLRAEFVRRAQRHGGVNAELAGFVGGRGDHAALVALAAHHDGFAFERGIEQLFHRHEKRVHVDMEYGPDHGFSQTNTRGMPARSGKISTLRQSRSSAGYGVGLAEAEFERQQAAWFQYRRASGISRS